MYNYLVGGMSVDDVCKNMSHLLESSSKAFFVFCITSTVMMYLNYNDLISIPAVHTILNINIALLVVMTILSLKIYSCVKKSYNSYLSYDVINANEFNKRIELLHSLGEYILIAFNMLSFAAVILITHNLVFNIL